MNSQESKINIFLNIVQVGDHFPFVTASGRNRRKNDEKRAKIAILPMNTFFLGSKNGQKTQKNKEKVTNFSYFKPKWP